LLGSHSMNPCRTTAGLCVAIISNNARTVTRLGDYLSEAGVTTYSGNGLCDLATVSPTTNALVIFPDEYVAPDATATLTTLHEQYPRLLVLIITSMPQRYESMYRSDDTAVAPIILPKPAIGWRILDAIRSQVRSESEAS
jgi:hypothetical protein